MTVLYRFPETWGSYIHISSFVVVGNVFAFVAPDVGVVVLQGAPALIMIHEAAGTEALGAGPWHQSWSWETLTRGHADSRIPILTHTLRVGEIHNLKEAARKTFYCYCQKIVERAWQSRRPTFHFCHLKIFCALLSTGSSLPLSRSLLVIIREEENTCMKSENILGGDNCS